MHKFVDMPVIIVYFLVYKGYDLHYFYADNTLVYMVTILHFTTRFPKKMKNYLLEEWVQIGNTNLTTINT